MPTLVGRNLTWGRILVVLATIALLMVLPVPVEPVAQAAGIAVPVRVRMDLDTRNMYLYENSATATTRLKDSAVSGLNANSWLDLSNAANNVATSKTSYCLAVNNNGYTVYVSQSGPVTSCANQTSISRVMVGEARTLTAPTSAAVSFSNATPTIGASFTASESGSNIARREWILPDGTSQAAATTTSVSYSSTGARSFTLRAVGTKGERVVTSSVAPTGLTVTLYVAGSNGNLGTNTWANFMSAFSQPGQRATTAGSGGRASGTYLVTSLPASFTVSSAGPNAGAGSTVSGGYQDQANGYYSYTMYAGGASGRSISIAHGGVTRVSAAGGAGGASGECCRGTVGMGYAGGAAVGSTAVGTGVTGGSTGTASGSPTATITLPGGQSRTLTGAGTITITSATAIS